MRSAIVPCGTISSSIFPCAEQLLERRRRGPRETANQFSHAAQLEQLGQRRRAETGIVGNDGQLARAGFDQAAEQLLRLTHDAETAEQDDRTVLYAGQSLRDGCDALVDHGRRSGMA
jgi:hypothetical protein